MSRDTWRDYEGFGRAVEVSPGTWSAVGPDNEDHAIHCSFMALHGILPCTCDATRREFSQWYKRWLRWQKARSVAYATQRPMPWPVTGPDGDPWVPGIDFNDEPAPASCPTHLMDGRNEIRCWAGPAGHAGDCK